MTVIVFCEGSVRVGSTSRCIGKQSAARSYADKDSTAVRIEQSRSLTKLTGTSDHVVENGRNK